MAVDDVDGSLHRQLDPEPHAAYLIGTDATVLFRTMRANDVHALDAALDAVAAGRQPQPSPREKRLVPMLRGTGCMWQSWERAGGHAKTDVLRKVPPVYHAGRLAGLVPGVSPLARGVAGNMAAMVPMVAGVAAVLRRRRRTGR